jgi:hypothetical protein
MAPKDRRFTDVLDGQFKNHLLRFKFSPETYYDSSMVNIGEDDGFLYFNAGIVFSDITGKVMSVKVYHPTRLVYMCGDIHEASRGRLRREAVTQAFNAPLCNVYDGCNAVFNLHKEINEIIYWQTFEFYTAWKRGTHLIAPRYLGILNVSPIADTEYGNTRKLSKAIYEYLDCVYKIGPEIGPLLVLSRNSIEPTGWYRWRIGCLSSDPMLYAAQHAHSSMDIL